MTEPWLLGRYEVVAELGKGAMGVVYRANDPMLNYLIETKKIEKIAMAKLKTYFTSTIWINEDDLPSYCALHLKDFGPDDRYRAHAWLVHSSKLNNFKF